METNRYRLDAEALSHLFGADVLALDASALGRSFAKASGAPKSERAGAKVALVRVTGPIAQRGGSDFFGYVDGYDAIAARTIGALEDPSVDGVVLAIDSPGGDVAGLEESARRIREAQARIGKPLVAYADELVASAAYWLAVAATTIVAPPPGRVGSIGVIAALVDETAALKQRGVKVTLIREPAGKVDAHPLGPIAALSEERVGARVKETAGRFFAAVASARGLSVDAVRGLNGAVLDAAEAKRAGLVDEIGSLEDAVRIAAGATTAATPKEEERRMKAEQSSKTFSRDEIRAAAREFQAPGVPAPAPDPSLEALRRGDEPSAELVAELAAMGCTVEDWRAAKAAGAL